MKSKSAYPMKSVLLKAVLCGAVSLLATAHWNALRGAVVGQAPARGGRTVAPKTHQAPVAPKPLVPAPAQQPKPLTKRGRRPGNDPKALPREAPRPEVAKAEAARIEAARIEAARIEAARIEAARIAGLRRAISIRDLEFVAHLRRQLFSHHWSFVYAANLKHAPKSIRFLQNGTVETELKGELWHWRMLDGRRVALSTVADESQPAITLEFDEGYTNFRYVLADESVAVQGATLDTIAEGPGNPEASAAASESPSKTLEEALLSYPWNWNDASGKSVAGVRFARNKSFRVAGRTSFWNVTGPRTVHVQFENGDQTDLLFDTTFSVYTDGNQISGSR